MKMDSLEARKSTTRARASTKRSQKTSPQSRKRSAARSAKSKGASARGGSMRRGAARRSGGAAKATTDLNEIRRWAEARGGKPVTVTGTAPRGKAGLLRIDFPGFAGGGRFQEISWDEWYQKFNENNLEFIYQDKGQSHFSKLVRRGTTKQGSSRRGSSSAGRKRTRAKASRSR